MENFIYIIISIVAIISLGTVVAYKMKQPENLVEEFGVKKDNSSVSEKDVKNIVNEIFSKLVPMNSSPTAISDVSQFGSNRVGVLKWFNVSSGNRDRKRYPSANNFVYKFPYKLWNVHSLELLKLSLPRGQFTIDSHNNIMEIEIDGSTLKTLELEVGFYDINSYLEEVNNVFSNNGIQLTAVYNNLKYFVELTNSGLQNYKFLYKSGPKSEDSNFNEMGFEKEDIEILSGQVYMGTRRVDLFGNVSIDISLKEINYDNNDNSLSSVLINNTALTIFENPHVSSRRHLRPLRNLTQLTIDVTFKPTFKERRHFNFNGLDFDMTLEVICVENSPVFTQELHKFQ